MHLLDLIEMIVDWLAATERHNDDNGLFESIESNQDRFGYSDEMKTIFENTAKWLYQIDE